MYEFKIITLFPSLYKPFFEESLLSRAIEQRLISHQEIDLRDFGIGKRRNVDAPPYGGGAGMVLRLEPLVNSLKENEIDRNSYRIALSAKGSRLTQKKAENLSKLTKPLVLIASRYEGYDERLCNYIDEEISIGDYILFGGDVASMVVIESVSRLIPGVLGNDESESIESFTTGLLEAPQYTKPRNFEGYEVPEVLLSGNHEKISEWRENKSLEITKERRPDLLKNFNK